MKVTVGRSNRSHAQIRVLYDVNVNADDLLQQQGYNNNNNDNEGDNVGMNVNIIKSMTIYICGSYMNGYVIGDLIRQCQHLKRLRIERKDDDWDAQNTRFTWTAAEEQCLANNGLSHHGSLQDIAIVGFACPIETLVPALDTMPNLSAVTLKADPHFAVKQTSPSSQPLLTTDDLQRLLRKESIQRLSFSGVFPEVDLYKSILDHAFLEECSPIHIFVHYAGTDRPSKHSYYLREMMELNQMGRCRHGLMEDGGRNNKNMLNLLKYASHKNRSSLDGCYLLIRENPWLCNPAVPTTESSSLAKNKGGKHKKWRKRIRRFFVSRMRFIPTVK